jgi:hypothetical protein
MVADVCVVGRRARREQEWQWLPTWPQAALLGAVAVLVGGILLYRHFKGSKQA